MKRSFLKGSSLLFGIMMENRLRERTPEEKHRNSLLRISNCCEIPRLFTDTLSTWEIEDAILSRLDQGKLAKINGEKKIRNLQKQIDMLKQISIFDFLKIHYDEIQSQKTPDFMDDDG